MFNKTKVISPILGLAMSLFLIGCAGGKRVSLQTPPAPIAAKPVDPNLPAEEKKIQVLARQIELDEAAKKNREELDKLRRPAEKKAEAIVRKEERRTEDRQNKDVKVLRNADIEGCLGGVNVSEWATGGRSYQAYGKTRVINTSGVAVDIVDSYKGETAVRNLCPGGSITLFRKIDFLRDSLAVSYQYIATGKFPDGSMGTAQSPGVYLSSYQTSYQNGQSQIWEIRLQKFLPQK